MVRAVLTFMLALTAIAFLIACSPIFLSFLLFKDTVYFFENWVKYMISYSMQIIIIFACIAMWVIITLKLITFFNDLSQVLFPYHSVETVSTSPISQPKDSVGICPYYFDPVAVAVSCDDPNNSQYYLYAAGDTLNGAPENLPIPANSPLIGTPRPAPRDGEFAAGDTANGKPVNYKIVAPNQFIGSLKPNAVGPTYGGTTVQPSAISKHQDLVYYIVFHLFALLVAAYAISALLKQTPTIARDLAGPDYVPILGQGMSFGRYGDIAGRLTQGAGGKGDSQVSDRGLLQTGFDAARGYTSQMRETITKRGGITDGGS
jgi:type IV secretory pathway VirB6-like protein